MPAARDDDGYFTRVAREKSIVIRVIFLIKMATAAASHDYLRVRRQSWGLLFKTTMFRRMDR